MLESELRLVATQSERSVSSNFWNAVLADATRNLCNSQHFNDDDCLFKCGYSRFGKTYWLAANLERIRGHIYILAISFDCEKLDTPKKTNLVEILTA